jgi:hypothetical protein
MLDSGKHIELIEVIEPFELIASKTQRPLQETLLRRTVLSRLSSFIQPIYLI